MAGPAARAEAAGNTGTAARTRRKSGGTPRFGMDGPLLQVVVGAVAAGEVVALAEVDEAHGHRDVEALDVVPPADGDEQQVPGADDALDDGGLPHRRMPFVVDAAPV